MTSYALRRYAVLAAGLLGIAAGIVGLVFFREPAALFTWNRVEEAGTGLAGALAFTIAGVALLGYAEARVVASVLLAGGLIFNVSLLTGGVALRTGSTALLTVSDVSNVTALFIAVAVLPQVFPAGFPTDRWRRLGLGCTLGVFFVALAAAMLATAGLRPTDWWEWLGWYALMIAIHGGMAVGAASLVVGWLRGSQLRRQQLGPLTITVLAVCAYLVASLTDPHMLGALWAGVIQGLYPPAAVLAIGAAVFTYHLYDIRPVIRRMAVYSLLTAAMAVSFFVAYGLFLVVVSQGFGGPRVRWLVVAVGLGVLVISWPMRVRLTAIVERRLLGERHDPLTALSRLPTSTTEDNPTLYQSAVEAVAAAVRSPAVALAVQSGAVVTVVAEHGGAAGDGVLLPLVHGGERLGELRVGLRTPGEAYGRADRLLLDQLAKQIAALLYGARRDTELRRARRKALAALADERERMGRDLHDGLAPLLAGASLTAEALRRGMPSGTPDEQEAHRLAVRLRAAATEIRQVAHDLQPSVVEHGLAAAVTGHVNGLVGPTVPAFRVAIEAPGLPPEISQTAYLVVLEAISNIVRHAHATKAAVDIAVIDDDLRLEVTDDGVGLATPYVSGLGITSMRGRVEALDGSFVIGPGTSGGTRLLAQIPVRS